MVAVDDATAATLLGQSVTAEAAVQHRIVYLLSRSLSADGISEELIDALDEILRGRPGAPTPIRGRRLAGLLARLGLPLPPSRPSGVAPLSPADTARITDQFRRATSQLIQIAPHRVAVYPTDELRRLLALRDERPAPDQALSHLRRYAMVISDLLDLMGDDE
ncbi:DUF6415 family natural product biosynthesis protein [Streptomyces sp. NPDC002055]|uniref:DUF6415 family natural product biosynthesis protein n=1 Tax=Streptomyces sp. NPDC002055 TaxID=3154534 RepID=UPI00331DC0F9